MLYLLTWDMVAFQGREAGPQGKDSLMGGGPAAALTPWRRREVLNLNASAIGLRDVSLS